MLQQRVRLRELSEGRPGQSQAGECGEEAAEGDEGSGGPGAHREAEEAHGEQQAGGRESSGTQPRRRRQKPQKNVLTRMPLCKGSPLGELYRCVEERIRVKVHIRTFKGLRGVCSGFVVAFDKFWNMAMVDVDETYREPLLGEAFYHEKALTISRLFDKLKIQQSSAGDELAKKPKEDQETATKHQPAHSTSKGGHSRTESKLSDAGKTKQDKHKVSLKDQSPEVCQKKDSQVYGKVRVRHINQLFIRGENVILVNPQPL
ncbi:U7 snRNA-associated Sm-like protein LSm11 [Larimichthys crocea]|uniref:U7 snRNA-associated Sm-like protein LSm11 n=1 Tax=Larimichthys crocea TaxID=215358 RepID=A0A6G0I4I1_LARCR|nr:U7 snRNA-associated Sm-like protein LSm11 [Larimichthys crocea]